MDARITLKQAAAEIGLKPVSLRAAVERGTLRAEKVGRDWLTTREWIDAYLAQRPEWAVRGAAITHEKRRG